MSPHDLAWVLQASGDQDPPVGPDDISVEILPASERDRAGELWRGLESRAVRRPLTCSWDWTEPWLEHYGDTVRHCFAVATVAGRPCAIALLTRSGVGRGALSWRTIRLGTSGEALGEGVYATYNDLLVTETTPGAFAQALLRRLRTTRRWDTIAFDRFSPDAARSIGTATSRIDWRRELCPAVDLTRADGGDVLSTLRHGTQQRVRRALRTLGDLTTDVARTPAEGLDVLDELIVLHQRRWISHGAPGAFASHRFSGFHRALVPRLLGRDAALLVRVRAGRRTVGCIYCFVDEGRALFYQSGLMSTADPKLKAGYVSHVSCMAVAAQRGLQEYNFLPEATRYKLELSNVEREVFTGVMRRRGPKGMLAGAARGVRRIRLLAS